MTLLTMARAAASKLLRPRKRQRTLSDLDGQVAAINRSHLVAEFGLDGKILSVNDNFCRLMGYSPLALIGQDHQLLMGQLALDQATEHQFWVTLASGQFSAGCYCRQASDGRDVWLQASYNPVLDEAGRPFKVIIYATDVTAQTMSTRSLHEAVQQLSEALNVSVAQSRDASAMASDASESVVRGSAVLEEIVETMRGMNRHADVISEIVGLIDNLAFQTDLLALNASMEVAWAGDDHGRGFAAVASEARGVARQSVQSAADLKKRLGSALDRAELGTDLSARASRAMQDIVMSITRVNDKMADIHDASLAQSFGVNALQDAVSRLEDASQIREQQVSRAA